MSILHKTIREEARRIRCFIIALLQVVLSIVINIMTLVIEIRKLKDSVESLKLDKRVFEEMIKEMVNEQVLAIVMPRLIKEKVRRIINSRSIMESLHFKI